MSRAHLFLNAGLAVCLAVLWGLSGALERGRKQKLRAASAFHALAGTGEPQAKDVARINLRLPGSTTTWSYVRRPEGWRMPQYRDAFADGQALDVLSRAFIEGRGTVAGHMPGGADHFGISSGRTLEAAFHDAAGTLLLKCSPPCE